MLKIFSIFFVILFLNTTAAGAEETQNKKEKNLELISEYKRQIKGMTSSRFMKYAKIQILNKNTAKTQDQKIAVGTSFKYGNIIITPHKCWQAPLTKKPDSKILLEVDEINLRDDNEINNIFLGWMISSSPSISGLEHPIYDITALNCNDE